MLVQVHLKGEGDEKFSSFLAYKLTLAISAINRKDETGAQTNQ
jgi:hypothetical protein